VTPSFSTRAVHAGRHDFNDLGVHAPPLDLSSTYPTPDLAAAAASYDALATGEPPRGTAVYSRLFNPTTDRTERALAELEGGEDAAAFASGMAAISAVLMDARQRGGHIVAVRPLYGGTDHLLDSGTFGLEVSWVQASDIAAAIRADTALVYIETPANPTLDLVDIADVVRQAGHVPVCVDSTFATPVLQRPLEHGATLVLHSATKFLGGHGDVLAGVVIGAHTHIARLKHLRAITGGVLHPLASYLLHRGLPTLELRVLRMQQTADILAHRLAESPHVQRVFYPGLPGQDPRGLVSTQMAGPGSILAFTLVEDTAEAMQRFISALKIITPAVSLGSTDTLIQPPAALTHRVVDPTAQAASHITPGLARLSVGLESPDDLWQDLAQALTVVERAVPITTGEMLASTA
jgi:methionine-gamma-lyase